MLCRRPAAGNDAAPPPPLCTEDVSFGNSFRTQSSREFAPAGRAGIISSARVGAELTLSEGWSRAADGCAFRQLRSDCRPAGVESAAAAFSSRSLC